MSAEFVCMEAMSSLQVISFAMLHSPLSPAPSWFWSSAAQKHSCPKLAQYLSQLGNSPKFTRYLHVPQLTSPSVCGHSAKGAQATSAPDCASIVVLLGSAPLAGWELAAASPVPLHPQSMSAESVCMEAMSSLQVISFAMLHSPLSPAPSWFWSSAAQKHSCPKLAQYLSQLGNSPKFTRNLHVPQLTSPSVCGQLAKGA